ncbi:MFS transporter [Kitasatospora sp. NPDC057198]|uniref:MFS transporter n=1 Tax=Kitasatospora sp. NPDC057198 TaxID=3346046 RepID=UPI003644C0C4
MRALSGGPMGVPGFRLLVLGQFASMVGDYCYAVALPWLVLGGGGGTALLGTVLACYGVARVATIPFGGILGPSVGGVLVAFWGSAPALGVDAASFLLSAAVLLRIRTPAPGPGAPEPGAGDRVQEPGPRFGEVLRRGRLLHVVVVVALICNLAFTGTMEVAMPDFAHRTFGAAGYGVLLTLLGAGALAGSALAARAGEVRRPARPRLRGVRLPDGRRPAGVPGGQRPRGLELVRGPGRRPDGLRGGGPAGA